MVTIAPARVRPTPADNEDIDSADVGPSLAARRKALGLRQAELASLVQVDQASLSRAEAGLAWVSPWLRRVRRQLAVILDTLEAQAEEAPIGAR